MTLPNDEKGKPRTWMFIMNSKLVDRWVEELDHFKNYPQDQSSAVKEPEKPMGELPKPTGSQLAPQELPVNTNPSNPANNQPPPTNAVNSLQPNPYNPVVQQSQVLAPPPQRSTLGSKVEPPAASNYQQPTSSNYNPPLNNSSQLADNLPLNSNIQTSNNQPPSNTYAPAPVPVPGSVPVREQPLFPTRE
jgi:hypothetical protein